KTERAHMPKNWWERVKFPRNYGKTLETIDSIWQVKLMQQELEFYYVPFGCGSCIGLTQGETKTDQNDSAADEETGSQDKGEAVVLDKVTHPFFRFDQLVSLLIMPSRLNC
ncbi:hypothetical protein HID58_060497, partial [Brassica napus]